VIPSPRGSQVRLEATRKLFRGICVGLYETAQRCVGFSCCVSDAQSVSQCRVLGTPNFTCNSYGATRILSSRGAPLAEFETRVYPALPRLPKDCMKRRRSCVEPGHKYVHVDFRRPPVARSARREARCGKSMCMNVQRNHWKVWGAPGLCVGLQPVPVADGSTDGNGRLFRREGNGRVDP
jgi:hypothetical protein